jgi:hypothetical protein
LGAVACDSGDALLLTAGDKTLLLEVL